MTLRMVCAGAVAAAGLAATPALAELRQFGNVIYPLPPGWSQPAQSDDRVTLTADLPDDRCEYCQLMIGPGAAASGSVTSWLDRNRLAFVDADERDDFKPVSPAEATKIGRREGAITAIGDGAEMMMLVAIRAGDRFELAGFKGDGGDPDELAESRKLIAETFLPWLSLLRFRSEGAPALLGAPTPGEMDGLWWGFALETVMGLDMTMRMENSYRRIVFWPDGTFVEGTPPGGMAPPDRAAMDAARQADWGNYRVEGATLTLDFADGSREVLERKDDAWSDGRHDLTRVAPLPDGARLDGGISSMSYTGFVPGTGVSGGVASSRETRFTPDGRFTGSSFGGAFGNFSDGAGGPTTGGFSTGSDRAHAGRYQIRDGLLVMTPETGPRSAAMVFRAGDEVMIGDDFFEGSVR